MGTSGSSKGSGSNTPFVPTWLDEPGTEAPPSQDESGTEAPPSQDESGTEAPPSQDDIPTQPPIEPAAIPTRFRGARKNFSTFAGSGGNNRGALRRALRNYVRSGTGGSKRATLRMGDARNAASKILSIIQSVQRDGLDATLRKLNIQGMRGQPPIEVFLELTDFICSDGGLIDEGIARDAWLETVAEPTQFEITDLENLGTDQIQELFLTFITHSIKTRIFQDIGAKGFQLPTNLSAIDAFEAQFHDYIYRAVQDAFASDLTRMPELSEKDIKNVVDNTYRDVWDLLMNLGDDEK